MPKGTASGVVFSCLVKTNKGLLLIMVDNYYIASAHVSNNMLLGKLGGIIDQVSRVR